MGAYDGGFWGGGEEGEVRLLRGWVGECAIMIGSGSRGFGGGVRLGLGRGRKAFRTVDEAGKRAVGKRLSERQMTGGQEGRIASPHSRASNPSRSN